MILIMASLTKASAILARCSLSMARRRFRLIQESVRSTIQCFGKDGEALLSWFRPDDLQSPSASPDDGALGFFP